MKSGLENPNALSLLSRVKHFSDLRYTHFRGVVQRKLSRFNFPGRCEGVEILINGGNPVYPKASPHCYRRRRRQTTEAHSFLRRDRISRGVSRARTVSAVCREFIGNQVPFKPLRGTARTLDAAIRASKMRFTAIDSKLAQLLSLP